ncbi:MAG TPA: hypothetical protein IAB18_02840 [Candidatus Avisuccinivibrio pullicola]|nr:hypothetical protein [Candidatus Avisuccinivibrio pullicola]
MKDERGWYEGLPAIGRDWLQVGRYRLVCEDGVLIKLRVRGSWIRVFVLRAGPYPGKWKSTDARFNLAGFAGRRVRVRREQLTDIECEQI